MSCTIGRSYTVQPGDTLYNIAQQQLGDGSRWREIKQADGSLLTDDDASNLQAGHELCIPNGTITSPVGNGFASIILPETYEAMFPNRNALYTYDSLLAAARLYSQFCNEGSDEQRKQEAAAFLANIAHETTGGWDAAPGGRFAWGLHFIEEKEPPHQYCEASNTTYPCVPDRSYHGRGPIQLSWNYNYGQMSEVLSVDLLSNPDLVKTDGVIAFQTALWFWMTPQSPKPSCHAVMTGSWAPSPGDSSKGRVPGFGMTINIINGGKECGIATIDKVLDRVGFYERFTQMLGVSMGENITCENMAHY